MEQTAEEKRLNRALWIAQQRERLKKLGPIGLGVVALASVLMFGYQMVQWVTHIDQTTRILQTLPEFAFRSEAQTAPQELQIRQPVTVRRNDTSVDVVSHVLNPNPSWAAAVQYRLQVGGQTITTKTVLLAPQQEHAVVATNIAWNDITLPVSEVELIETQWRRIPPGTPLPQTDWQLEEPNLDVVRLDEPSAELSTRFTGTLYNRSSVGFRNPQVVIELYDEDQNLIALDQITLTQILNQEHKPLLFYWPQELPTQAHVVVTINANIIDSAELISS